MATTFVSIGAAVGIRNGTVVLPNQTEDLETITDLFDRIAFSDGGTREIGGLWATDRNALIAEITAEIIRFQTMHGFQKPDGAIDRGGRTLRLMNQLASEPPEPPLIRRLEDSPPWEDWGHTNLPPISHSQVPEIVWEMTFGGGGDQPDMSSRSYACHKKLGTPHIGVGWPTNAGPPDAYLIYFHHSIGQEQASYASSAARFRKGIGDYLIGRMKGLDQIARSGKNVCMVVPEPTFAGQGIFDHNAQLVAEVIKQIDADITGGEGRDDVPLLLASYSDGLERMDNFLTNCRTLRTRVRGVFDFDGMLVTRLSRVTLLTIAKEGAKVFRYVGNSSPGMLPHENPQAYLARCVNRQPFLIPLPKPRWVNHPHYGEFKSNASWANSWWMHFYVPSCMLQHGLANISTI